MPSLKETLEAALIDLVNAGDLKLGTDRMTVVDYFGGKIVELLVAEDKLNIADKVFVSTPLSPEEVNTALKAFGDDGDRVLAMKNICKCGTVTDDGWCWGCYESPYPAD